jgi:hypothetical protein
MHGEWSRTRIFALLLGAISLVLAGWASADPPSRVARLGYMTGPVSFSPAGEDDWMQARINRPLTIGDRLWADAGARTEIQLGGTMIRMNEGSGISILNLDDRIAQFELMQGSLNVNVLRLDSGQVFEIGTPNLALVLRQPGAFRIDVDPDGDTTTIVMRSGQGEVYGDDAAYTIDSRQPYRFTGTDLREYRYVDAPSFDEFDRWSAERDRRGAVSARYVSPYVIGYEDLDEYGSWRTDADYGNVWMPTRVTAEWAPYRDGHWAWVDPWGWTWVDDAPWGFAVSHYGRWANIRGSWVWIPGPVRSRAVYAPALVGFVGGSNFQITISLGTVAGIAWFPLGPRDVYRPSYPVSRSYFSRINSSNTRITTTNITNVYNNVNVQNITYVNQRVPGAIVAVPHTAFVQSQPVGRAGVRLSREAVASAPVTAVAAVAPIQTSVHGAAAPGRRPPAQAQRRPVVAKAPPPPAPVPFAARQSALAAQPGRPLDAAGLAAVKPVAPAPAPSIKVVSPTQRAVAPPKPRAEASGSPQVPDVRKAAQPPVVAPAPVQAPKAPQRPQAQEAPKASVSVPPPAAQKAPQRPEAEETPKAPVIVPAPVQAPKAPRRPEVQEPPKAPVVVPPPPAAQKALPPRPDAARSAEERGARKSEVQLKLEEKLNREGTLKPDEKLRLEELERKRRQ